MYEIGMRMYGMEMRMYRMRMRITHPVNNTSRMYILKEKNIELLLVQNAYIINYIHWQLSVYPSVTRYM